MIIPVHGTYHMELVVRCGNQYSFLELSMYFSNWYESHVFCELKVLRNSWNCHWMGQMCYMLKRVTCYLWWYGYEPIFFNVYLCLLNCDIYVLNCFVFERGKWYMNCLICCCAVMSQLDCWGTHCKKAVHKNGCLLDAQ